MTEDCSKLQTSESILRTSSCYFIICSALHAFMYDKQVCITLPLLLPIDFFLSIIIDRFFLRPISVIHQENKKEKKASNENQATTLLSIRFLYSTYCTYKFLLSSIFSLTFQRKLSILDFYSPLFLPFASFLLSLPMFPLQPILLSFFLLLLAFLRCSSPSRARK